MLGIMLAALALAKAVAHAGRVQSGNPPNLMQHSLTHALLHLLIVVLRAG